MVKAFLDSVLKGVGELGWASAKKVAEHTDWAVENVLEALKQLESEGKIRSRAKGRGYQYGPLEIAKKQEEEKQIIVPSEPAPPSDTTFSTLDDFLLQGIRALPKDRAFSANDFGEEMIKAFPNTSWTKDDVIGGIGKLVRLGRLGCRPFTDTDSRLKYQYIVN